MSAIFDQSNRILCVCDYIVKNARLDSDGHLVIEIRDILAMLRGIALNDIPEEYRTYIKDYVVEDVRK